MSLVLTSAFLLMLASSSFEVDVEIVMKNEPWSEVDTAPHELQAEEKLFGNPCVSKKTCGECIRNPGCAWCASQDKNYTSGGKKRCDYIYTILRECGREDYVTGVTGKTIVEFYMTLKPLSCPENTDEWNPIMQFRRLHGERVVREWKMNLGLLCKCECEMPKNQERNSPKCSGRGTYECGICRCHDNWYGKECECQGKPSGDYDEDDVNKACIAPGDTKICSGRGKCHCGTCECFNKTSVTGRFCECDVCPRSEGGQICGGEERGKCVCGKCECTDEWTGPACDCTKDIELCRSPYNGIICHGFGECICGKCYCFEKDGFLHSGPFCEDCAVSCPCMSCRRCLGPIECQRGYVKN